MSEKIKEQPSKSRNAAQTKEAILTAAQKCFSQQRYDQVGVRDIAAAAGINAALVIRYFGSKEQLFTTAVAEAFDVAPFLEEGRENLGEFLARCVIEEGDEDFFNPTLALLRSVVSPQGSLLLRQVLEKKFIQPLAEWLGGDQSLLRANLIASTMLGLSISRDVIETGPLAESDPEALIAAVAPALQGYIDGMP